MIDITRTLLNSYAGAYSNMLFDSEAERLATYRRFTAMYEKDADEVLKILKLFYLDRPFSADTLKRMPLVYDDIIEKILQRKTAGLIAKPPSIELIAEATGEGAGFDITPVLEELNLFVVLQDALLRSEFYNIVILQPVYRDGAIQVDVITPDECSVRTGEDYLKIAAISVARVNADGELYTSRWTETEHSIVDANGEDIPPPDNPQMVNPYGRLPFVVFRNRNGRDFWGEPNWSLYYEQLSYLMSKNDALFGEYFQKFPILYGVNFPLADKQKLGPGDYLEATNLQNNLAQPRLEVLNFQTDWENIRANQRARLEQFYINQGLPASSFATDRQSLSGDAKAMDEKELEESRDRKRASIVRMITELLDTARTVWNYHKDNERIPEDGFKFRVQLNDQNDRISPSELKALREIQITYGIADPITFIMQDLDLTQDEAIAHYQKIQTRMQKIQQQAKKPSLLDFLNRKQEPEDAR